MVRRQTRVQKRNRRQQNKSRRNNRRQNKSLRRKRQSRRKLRGGSNPYETKRHCGKDCWFSHNVGSYMDGDGLCLGDESCKNMP